MSRPANSFDVLDSPDSNGDFGRDEGMAAYEVVAGTNPDRTIEASAKLAAGVAVIVTGRLDVNLRAAEQTIISEVTSVFPEGDKEK